MTRVATDLDNNYRFENPCRHRWKLIASALQFGRAEGHAKHFTSVLVQVVRNSFPPARLSKPNRFVESRGVPIQRRRRMPPVQSLAPRLQPTQEKGTPQRLPSSPMPALPVPHLGTRNNGSHWTTSLRDSKSFCAPAARNRHKYHLCSLMFEYDWNRMLSKEPLLPDLAS